MATKPSGKKPAPEQAPTHKASPGQSKKDSPGSAASGKRKRVDWAAVERDYRTDHFTNVEICAKHGIDPATLSRKIKKDQGIDHASWQKDLTAAVRAATNAALMTEMVKSEINQGQEQVNLTVKAAAEVNKSVILGHRKDITATRNVAAALLDELADSSLLSQHKEILSEILAGDGAEPVDVARAQASVRKALGVGARVASVKALAETFTKLQAMERVAFNLDAPEKDNDGDDSRPKLTDAERAVRLARLLQKSGS